jgi:hypothetical protein
MNKLSVVSIALAVSTLFTSNAQAFSRDVKIVSLYNGNCLENTGYKDDTAAKRTCYNDNSDNFVWTLQSFYGDDYYTIISKLDNSCLDDQGYYVGVWSDCHNKGNQRWHLVNDSSGGFLIKAGYNTLGDCLDMGTSNGKTYSWRCHGDYNQLWNVIDVRY